MTAARRPRSIYGSQPPPMTTSATGRPARPDQEPINADPYTRIAWLHEQLDALLADTLVLMDQHASDEVKMEARRRIIERHGEVVQ